jgi:hypothetical protein
VSPQRRGDRPFLGILLLHFSMLMLSPLRILNGDKVGTAVTASPRVTIFRLLCDDSHPFDSFSLNILVTTVTTVTT